MAEASGTIDNQATADIEQALRQVIGLYEAGQHAAALESAQRLDEQFPGNPDILHIVGGLFKEKGRVRAALPYLARAVELAPDSPLFLYNYGLALQADGRLDKALEQLLRVTELAPTFGDGYAALGAIYAQLGKLQSAGDACSKALTYSPNSVSTYLSLGLTLQLEGDRTKAAQAFARVISLEPRNVAARHNLVHLSIDRSNYTEARHLIEEGVRLDLPRRDMDDLRLKLLAAEGKLEDAGALVESIIKSGKPTSMTYLIHALLRQMKPADNPTERRNMREEALALLKKSVKLDKRNYQAIMAIADIEMDRGYFRQAIRVYKRALAIRPRLVDAYFRLSQIETMRGRKKRALDYLRQAVEAAPDDYQPLIRLGKLLKEYGRSTEAFIYLEKASTMLAVWMGRTPNDYRIYVHLAEVLWAMNKLAHAAQAYSFVSRFAPWEFNSRYQLAIALHELGRKGACEIILRRLHKERPKNEEVKNLLAGILLQTGEAGEANALWRSMIKNSTSSTVMTNFLFSSLYLPVLDPKKMLKEHKMWEKRFPVYAKITRPPRRPAIARGAKIRVGYISPDFKRHSVFYFAEPLLDAHDRKKFEIYLYGAIARPDDFTDRIAALGNWRSVNAMPDYEVLKLMKHDNIDILVDLSGHTRDTRLSVSLLRPARTIYNYIGYPATTGVSTVDYRFTDAWADPVGQTEQYHTEKLVRLNGGFLCFTPPQDVPDVGPPPSPEAGFITFGSFNNFAKISDPCLEMWSQILSRVPNSRLLLKSGAIYDDESFDRLRKRFSKFGINDEQVVCLAAPVQTRDHLEIYNQVDVGLDTWPYHGTTTTCEAIWMGVPVVSRAGDIHVSRVAVSLLSTTGLEDTIAYSAEEYVEKAVQLAFNVEERRRRRAESRARAAASPLLDRHRLASEIEAHYISVV